jgi:hypothetical protein
MGSNGIRPSSDFFFLRLRLISVEGHVGGYGAETRIFQNSKHTSPRAYAD